MSKNIEFTEALIKGRIAEIIFSQMFKEVDEFKVFPLGYENTTPELTDVKGEYAREIIKDLRSTPDFALISKDNSQVYLVEVKYRNTFDPEIVLKDAEKVSLHDDKVHIFISTSEGFYFESCRTIKNRKGNIDQLGIGWIPQIIQDNYHKLLIKYYPDTKAI